MMGKTHRAIGYTTTLVLIVYTDIGVIPPPPPPPPPSKLLNPVKPQKKL